MIFGGKDSRAFQLGNSSESAMLYILFFIACFIIKIHLLNMLINIMRAIFADRAAHAQELMVRDRLKFVLANWHYLHRAVPDIK